MDVDADEGEKERKINYNFFLIFSAKKVSYITGIDGELERKKK